jgi:hypothetical protein
VNVLRADSKAVESSQHSIADRRSEPRQSLPPSRYSDPPARTFDRAEYEMASSNLPSSQPEENVPVKTEKRKNEETDDYTFKNRKTVSQGSTNTTSHESSQPPLTGKDNIPQPVKSSASRPATVKLSSSCRYMSYRLVYLQYSDLISEVYCSDRSMATTPIQKIVSTSKVDDKFRLICSFRDHLPKSWDKAIIDTYVWKVFTFGGILLIALNVRPAGKVFGFAAIVMDEAGDCLTVAITGSEAEQFVGCRPDRYVSPLQCDKIDEANSVVGRICLWYRKNCGRFTLRRTRHAFGLILQFERICDRKRMRMSRKSLAGWCMAVVYCRQGRVKCRTF